MARRAVPPSNLSLIGHADFPRERINGRVGQ
jgi:hypothetical protein